jgi:hypothetical protein
MDYFSLQVKPLAHLLIAPGRVDCKCALIQIKKTLNIQLKYYLIRYIFLNRVIF